MKRLLPALLLAACSGTDYKTEFLDTGLVESEVPSGTLRLDILPPGSTADGTLLPQSLIVPPRSYESVSAALHRTRTLTGTLLAEVAHAWSAGGAPTTLELLPATLLALPEGGLLGGSGQSDDEGSFTFSFPDYDDPLALVIQPVDPSMAPMTVLEEPPEGRTDWSQRIEPGIPIYGRVSGRVGEIEQGVGDVAMRLSKLAGDSRVYGGVFVSDSTGWYVAQVDAPGDYELEILGGPTATGRVASSRVIEVMVEDEEGVEVGIELGDVGDVQVEGRVEDAQGNRLGDARVRFTSRTLDGSFGSLVVETSTTPRGEIFSSELLAGVYDVEIWPASEEGAVRASPLRLPRVAISGDTGLGTLVLGPATTLEGHISTAAGESAPNVLIVATETAFGGYTFYGRTDDDGNFAFSVPTGALDLILTPPDPSLGAITRLSTEDASVLPGGLVLDAGTALSGQVSWDGAGVAFALINVYDARTDDLLGTVLSGEDGRFSLNVSIPLIEDTDTGDADTATTGGDSGTAETGGTDTGGAETGGADTGGADTGGADTGGTGSGDTGSTGDTDTARP